jgi:hypothetical protein
MIEIPRVTDRMILSRSDFAKIPRIIDQPTGRDTLHPSPHFSHSRGRWLGPCPANSFSRLANTSGIDGGAKTSMPTLGHENALRHRSTPMWRKAG